MTLKALHYVIMDFMLSPPVFSISKHDMIYAVYLIKFIKMTMQHPFSTTTLYNYGFYLVHAAGTQESSCMSMSLSRCISSLACLSLSYVTVASNQCR